ncbi:MAG TPA: NADH-quinone oxidoreductase subunit J [Fibrobacteria bacterium]|nr:NADH-quinone oxidoreductase subunit J [Fibrobacteria bacterium]
MPVSPVVEITFALSAVVILLSSLAVVLVKNPVRATLLLILSFLPTSLVYILLQAAFVGILQILVYAGAIMMLFTFVIMMINPSPKDGESPVGGSESGEGTFSGLRGAMIGLFFVGAAGALLLPMVYRAASQVDKVPVTKPGFGGLASIAALLFEDPANNPLTVSFELISFLILVGIIAALNFSRRKGAAAAREASITTRPTEALPIVQREAALDAQ